MPSALDDLLVRGACALCRMHHVVVDEADLLLTGGFERDTVRLLEGLQQGDRDRHVQAACAAFGLHGADFEALPRHQRQAAAQGKQCTSSLGRGGGDGAGHLQMQEPAVIVRLRQS